MFITNTNTKRAASPFSVAALETHCCPVILQLHFLATNHTVVSGDMLSRYCIDIESRLAAWEHFV